MIESILIYGLLASGVLALLALGFTLIYGVAEVVNMAHGALYMTGTYIFWLLTAPELAGLMIKISPIKLNLGLALIIAIIISGIIGAIVYRLTIHPIVEDLLAVLIVTVGVSMLFQSVTAIQFSAARRSVPYLIEGTTTILGVKVTYSKILSFIISLVLFASLWIFTTKTKIGTAMRAVAQDREAAMLMGINNERLYMLTMGIASAFAAIAGILITTEGFAEPYMWTSALYFSFAIVIVGGIGSIKGTLIGALIVGYAGETFVALAGEVGFLRGAVGLATMVIVLILRPRGIFGKRIEMEE
ncbi:MAG: branched-chain amino acid ABC transporter permease [Candidatus Bathyarchaeaceae archaeon]